jgi:Bacterial extracellular solute-binding proteins, family 5 Middle
MRPSRAASPLFGTVLFLVGCKTPSPTPTASPARSCEVGAAQRVPAESISVALTGPISPAHAPRPGNPAERFVFAQLYETLIQLDCDGRAAPGLARSWTIDATKTRVTLVLRDNARFWNGDLVTTRDVVTAWQATAATPADSNQLAHRLVNATTIVDDRTLTVSLPNTDSLVLVEPALAVYRRTTGAVWPQGTGPYRAAESARDVAPGQLTLTPMQPTAPRLAIRSGPDARDAIDTGVDLLVTADPVALSYASTRPEYSAVPLPWNRTYALAVPSRSPSAVAEALSPSRDSAAFRASLARDAVRADARTADMPAWWTSIQGCESNLSPGSPNTGRRSQRIVYRADDHVARELAERLVAVGGRATAAALAPADFARAWRAGNELAYIVALSRTPPAPCFDLGALLSSAPWLGGGSISDALVPLVDTRDKAVMRRDRVSASVDWDGTLRVSRP